MPLDTLGRYRMLELEQALGWLGRIGHGGRILELGAGTGQQAAELARRGFRVDAIDLPDTPYRDVQVFPVATYDGRHLPFPDATFDAVFSSSVLEHVRDLDALLADIRRVLKPGGLSVHIMPTPAWRAWSFVTHFGWGLKRLIAIAGKTDEPAELGRPREGVSLPSALSSVLPRRHGEHGTAVGELLSYRRTRWLKILGNSGLEPVGDESTHLLYTNALLFGDAIPVRLRRFISPVAGSACHLYCFRRPLERDDARDEPRPGPAGGSDDVRAARSNG